MNDFERSILKNGRLSFSNPSFIENPFEGYSYLRKFKPVCKVESSEIMVVSGYRDIKYILQNPDIFSSKDAGDMYIAKWLQGVVSLPDSPVVFKDKPEHTLQKKNYNKDFTSKKIENLKSSLEGFAESLINNIPRNTSIDFLEDVAYPYTEKWANEFLGVNESERCPEAIRWAALIDAPPLQYDEKYLDNIKLLSKATESYSKKLIRSRMAIPRNDYIQDLISSNPDNNKHELILLLYRANIAPVSHLLMHGIFRLSEDGNLLDQLKSQPEKIALFIDELIRYDTTTHTLGRKSLSTTTLLRPKTTIPKNTNILLLVGSANRDPEQFERPEAFDIDRDNNNTHLAMGYGIHRCIGEAFVKAQLNVFYKALLSRFSNISCPLSGQLEWYHSIHSHFIKRLNVSFE